MTHGIEKNQVHKKHKGLIEEKDYITEAYLQGGKAFGEILKPKKKQKE